MKRQYHGLRTLSAIAALLVGLACNDSSPLVPDGGRTDLPLPPEIELLELSLGFGDAPVAGELRIVAATATDWEYSIDLDEDGRPDESGPLHLGVVLPYAFEAVGIHRIRVTLERGEDRRVFERLVVVNDPDATELVRQVELDPATDAEPRALVLDEEGDRLLVVDAMNFVLFNLDPDDLSERWRLPFPGTRYENGYQPTQGILLSGDVLYVDIGDSLAALDVGDTPELIGPVADAHWGPHLASAEGGSIYNGGFAGVGVVNPQTGAVEASLDLPLFGGHFAVSPDGNTIAYLQDIYLDPSLLLIDARTLTEVGRLSLGNRGSPLAVAFHPSGDRVYMFTKGPEWHMTVVEMSSLGIQKDVILARGTAFTQSSLGRIAWTPDRRFLVIVNPYGVYFIDTLIDHPLYRHTFDQDVPFCCSIAASRNEPLFHATSSRDGTITTIRFLR